MFSVFPISHVVRSRLVGISENFKLDENTVIAGGAVLACCRGMPIEGDIDVWVSTVSPEPNVEEISALVPRGVQTQNNYTLDIKRESAPPINVICVWAVPESGISRAEAIQCVVKNFDMDCVRAYWDGSELYVTPEFTRALELGAIWADGNPRRDLPARTIERVTKYLGRGLQLLGSTYLDPELVRAPCSEKPCSEKLRSIPIRKRDLPAFWHLYRPEHVTRLQMVYSKSV